MLTPSNNVRHIHKPYLSDPLAPARPRPSIRTASNPPVNVWLTPSRGDGIILLCYQVLRSSRSRDMIAWDG